MSGIAADPSTLEITADIAVKSRPIVEALGGVLARMEVFMKVADELAKVSPFKQRSLFEIVINSLLFPGSSVHQSSMADCFFAPQSKC